MPQDTKGPSSNVHSRKLQILALILMLGPVWWFITPGLAPRPKIKAKVKRQVNNTPATIHKPNPWVPYYNRGKYAGLLDIPTTKVSGVNCKGLILGKVKGNQYEKVEDFSAKPDQYFLNVTKNCRSFVHNRQYITKPVFPEEEEFPLAFSLIVYKNVHQVEQLLRAIYRPQNFYCIHVDLKAGVYVKMALAGIANCLPNVFIATRTVKVVWGEYSVLDAEFACMETFWNMNATNWRYLINLTGQEYPLKTNLDLVHILKAYNGSNAIAFDHKNFKHLKERVQYKFRSAFRRTMTKTSETPYNLKIAFGSIHAALTKGFVDFLLHHQLAQDFKQWVRSTNVPDETFFASLQVNPELDVPGSFTGDYREAFKSHDPFVRYKQWYTCKQRTIMVRGICILGVHDLHDLQEAPHMFANKFFPEHQPIGRMCLEEYIFDRTREQIKGQAFLNLDVYKKQSFVIDHYPS